MIKNTKIAPIFLLAFIVAAQSGCAALGLDLPNSVHIPRLISEELRARQQTDDKIVLLDVRKENEYSEVHIPDATWFPKSRFDKEDSRLLDKLKTFDSNSIFVAYCGAGHRSSFVTRRLRDMGLNAYNLEGISFWQKKGFPVIHGPKLPPSIEPAVVNLTEAYEHYYVLFKDVVWVDVREHKSYKTGKIKVFEDGYSAWKHAHRPVTSNRPSLACGSCPA